MYDILGGLARMKFTLASVLNMDGTGGTATK